MEAKTNLVEGLAAACAARLPHVSVTPPSAVGTNKYILGMGVARCIYNIENDMRDSSATKQKDEVFMFSRVAQEKVIAHSYCRACTMSAAII